jgi:thiol-disulfide isomerase/thioredoxin
MNFKTDLPQSLMLNGTTGAKKATSELLADKTAVFLYFSAHWCPPCRQFTPMLVQAYNQHLKKKGVEVIFVSSDRDESSFKDYFGQMPWLAVEFSDRKTKEILSTKFEIQGIPALIALDSTGKLISKDARSVIMSDPSASSLLKGLPTKSGNFTGTGQSVGSSSAGISSVATANPAVAAASAAVVIDRTKPVTKLQLRFPDGSKCLQEFNDDMTIMKVKEFAKKCVGNKSVKLATGFPPADLLDEDRTLKDAALFDTVIVVKLA